MHLYMYIHIHSTNAYVTQYRTWEIFGGEMLVNLVIRELFGKFFLANIHRHTEMHLAYELTVAYSPNFLSPTAFTCMVHQNFPH